MISSMGKERFALISNVFSIHSPLLGRYTFPEGNIQMYIGRRFKQPIKYTSFYQKSEFRKHLMIKV